MMTIHPLNISYNLNIKATSRFLNSVFLLSLRLYKFKQTDGENMAGNNNISRMTIDLSKEDHKKLKAVAAILGKSMREVVLEAVEKYLHDSNAPSSIKVLAQDFSPLAKD